MNIFIEQVCCYISPKSLARLFSLKTETIPMKPGIITTPQLIHKPIRLTTNAVGLKIIFSNRGKSLYEEKKTLSLGSIFHSVLKLRFKPFISTGKNESNISRLRGDCISIINFPIVCRKRNFWRPILMPTSPTITYQSQNLYSI